MSTRLDDFRRNAYAEGYSEQDVNQWINQRRRAALDNGYTEQEVNEFLGAKPFDKEKARGFWENIQAQTVGTEDMNLPSIQRFLAAGWDNSNTGLIQAGELPDSDVPQEAPLLQTVARMAGAIAGDFPFMVAGAFAQGVPATTALTPIAGPLAPVLGSFAAWGGAVGVPQATRAYLLDAYENGEIDNPEELWNRLMEVGKEYVKGNVVGMASRAGFGAGGAAGTALATKAGGGQAGKEITKQVGQWLGGATAGTYAAAGLEGRLPTKQEFMYNSIILPSARGAVALAQSTENGLKSAYRKYGKTPTEARRDAESDLSVKEDLMGGRDYVRAYELDPESTKRSILEKVVDAPQPEKVEQGNIIDQFNTKVIDQFAPYARMMRDLGFEKEAKYRDGSPYAAMTMLLTRQGRVHNFLKRETATFENLGAAGPGLEPILRPVQKKPDQLIEYVVARRALELAKRDIKTPIDLDEAKSAVKEASPDIVKAGDQLNKYSQDLLAYLRDSGVISKNTYKAIIDENEFYAPMYRAVEGGKMKPLKRIKGSEKDLLSPLVGLMQNTNAIVSLAERNRAYKSLYDFANTVKGADEFIKIIKSEKEGGKVSAKQMNEIIEKAGQEDFNPIEAAKAEYKGIKENQIVYYNKGNRVVLELTPDMMDGIRALESQQYGWFMKTMQTITAIKRFGITADPTFATSLFLATEFANYVQARGKYVPVVGTLEGFGNMMGNSEYYKEFLRTGVSDVTFLNQGRNLLDENYLSMSRIMTSRKARNELITPGQVASGSLMAAKAAKNALRDFANLGEVGPRMNTYIALRESGASVHTAALEAADLSGFWSRGGTMSAVRNWGSVNAFFVAVLQSMYRTGRSVDERPATTTAKGLAAITLPALMLHSFHHYDTWFEEGEDGELQFRTEIKEWYAELDDWVKDNYFVINVGSDESPSVLRIRKPFDLGLVFGSLAERMYDTLVETENEGLASFSDNMTKNIFGGTGQTAASLLSMNLLIPDPIEGVVQQAMNYNFFADAPVIPVSEERILPFYQSTRFTTETSKALAEAMYKGTGGFLNVSPIQFEQYIRTQTGMLGTKALDGIDRALRNLGVVDNPPEARPDRTLMESMFLSTFQVRYPSMSAKSVTEFYNTFDKLGKIERTMRKAQREQDFDEYTWWLENSEYMPGAAQYARQQQSALSQAMKSIRQIEKIEMPLGEKDALIEQLIYSSIIRARIANEVLEKYKRK